RTVFLSSTISCIRAILSKSFGKIPTDTINSILFYPMFDNSFGVVFCIVALMVEIIPHVVTMHSLLIEIRIFSIWLSPSVIFRVVHPHSHHWVSSESMIDSQVKDYGYSVFVTQIHEFFKLVRRSVILIQSHVKSGIVTPTFVTFIFHNRHELNGVYVKAFEVVDTVYQILIISVGIKVTNQDFIDNQFLFFRLLKVGHLPLIFLLSGLQYCHLSFLPLWFSRHIRITRSRNPWVIKRRQNRSRIRVCCFHNFRSISRDISHIAYPILVGVNFLWF